jgi:quinol monooxygenase YgiN
MLTEVIRIPVTAEGEQPLLDFLDGHPHFEQAGCLSAKRFRAHDGPGVLMLIEWDSMDAQDAAIASTVGKEFLAAVGPLMAGTPDLAFYHPED